MCLYVTQQPPTEHLPFTRIYVIGQDYKVEKAFASYSQSKATHKPWMEQSIELIIHSLKQLVFFNKVY